MKHGWTADVANDPDRDYELCVELSLNAEHRASVLRLPSGELVIRWYADAKDAELPASWLIQVLQRAERELV